MRRVSSLALAAVESLAVLPWALESRILDWMGCDCPRVIATVCACASDHVGLVLAISTCRASRLQLSATTTDLLD